MIHNEQPCSLILLLTFVIVEPFHIEFDTFECYQLKKLLKNDFTNDLWCWVLQFLYTRVANLTRKVPSMSSTRVETNRKKCEESKAHQVTMESIWKKFGTNTCKVTKKLVLC